MHLSTSGIITGEQVEAPMGFLIACQHQASSGGVTPPTVRFHGDGFDIEKQEMPISGQMPENPAQASQNCRSLRIRTEQLALHPREMDIVFLTTGASVRARSTSQDVA